MNNIFQVYEAIVLWVKHDKKNRAKFMPELFQNIRFLSIPIEYIKDKIEKEKLIISDVKCKLCFIFITIPSSCL